MSNKGYITKEQAQKIYESFKIDANREKLIKTSTSQKNAELFLKIVDYGTEEDFVTYLSEGEMPPLKLENSEMEALQGGCSPVSLVIIGTIIVTYTHIRSQESPGDDKEDMKLSTPIKFK